MVDLEFEDEDYSPSTPSAPTQEEWQSLVLGPEHAGLRLDQALAVLLPETSRSRLAALIKEGAVQVEGKSAAPKDKMRGSERIAVHLKPRAEDQAFQPEAIPLAIVHEDQTVLVIDKPPGLVVHPAAGNWTGTLLNGLLHHDPALSKVPRAGIVHRLDKDTSGLMVVAKTEAAQLDLVRQLQARTVKREYTALAQGAIERDGKVDAAIGRHPRTRTKMAVVAEAKGGKPAVTHYRVLERMPRHTLVECRLETGRTHQIRVHMQSIGFPLEGDTTYGARKLPVSAALRAEIDAFQRQALHARRLAFLHPATRKAVEFQSALPADIETLIEAARKG
jgi:23S rRNA pseudouridine1911/1915/1917 synthase